MSETKDTALEIFAVGDLSQLKDIPDGPAVILVGSKDAVKEAAKLLFENVRLVLSDAAREAGQ